MKLTPKILKEQEFRYQNFVTLIKKITSKTEIGNIIDVHPSYITHILTKKRGIGSYLAKRIEKAFNKQPGHHSNHSHSVISLCRYFTYCLIVRSHLEHAMSFKTTYYISFSTIPKKQR